MAASPSLLRHKRRPRHQLPPRPSGPRYLPSTPDKPPLEGGLFGLTATLSSVTFDKPAVSIVLDISNESDSMVEISDDAFYLLTDAVHVLIGADDSATAKICIEESKTLNLKFPALPQKMKTVTLVCGLHFPQYMLTFEQGVPQSA